MFKELKEAVELKIVAIENAERMAVLLKKKSLKCLVYAGATAVKKWAQPRERWKAS